MKITIEQPGKTESVLVEDHSTVREVIHLATGSNDASRYSVRVNDEKSEYDDEMSDGDILSLVPRKVDGA